MDDEKKIALAWVYEIKCKCPYCEEEQETICDSGELDTCEHCKKEFVIGEIC